MKLKMIVDSTAGMLLAVAVMLTACSGEKPSATDTDADTKVEGSASPAAVEIVKILPPLGAYKMAMADPGGKECPHETKENLCYICNPKMRDPKRMWCKEHGRYEERCFECHPDLKEKGRLMCKEHFLYEDECYICHPDIMPSKAEEGSENPQANKGGAGSPAGLMCNEHNVLEAECGICHPDMLAKNHLKVRFASKQAAAKAGVSVTPAAVEQISDEIEVYAELAFNENRLTEIALPVQGIVKSVEVDLGSKVEKGEVLVTVSSVEISAAAGKYQLALTQQELAQKALDREQKLSKQKISSQQELDEAEARMKTAEVERRQAYQQLVTLGFDSKQVERLNQNPDEAVVLELRAPFAGEIAERNAVQGSWLEAGTALFKLVDTRSLWAFLSIPESDLQRVKVGQVVKLVIESRSGEVFEGKLTWIAPSVDERTRTARARAEFLNPDGVLKAQMFAKARIINRSSKNLIIPQSAVQDIEGNSVAFVRLEDDLFDVRMLKTGVRGYGRIEILDGLKVGDQVVTGSSFIVKSQFLISRLGAGCVDD
ncbi:MAG: efflux RND transporter periplasmic adaptor subunit [Verrucomicrobiota bacterium]